MLIFFLNSLKKTTELDKLLYFYLITTKLYHYFYYEAFNHSKYYCSKPF
jgi:hypothetical protein